MTFICIRIRVCIYYDFFSNFIIILLCENFISYHKSGSETVTYLIELLNNFNIPAMSRIFIYSFPLTLGSPNVKQTAPNVALWGQEIRSTHGILSTMHKKWDHAFEGLGTGPDTVGAEIKANSLIPLSCLFLLCTDAHTYAHVQPPPFSLEERHILEESFLTVSHLTLL